MKTLYNEELHKNEWIVSKWYEKTFYVVGVIYSWFVIAIFSLAFVVGFAAGILE
jgi:hypothetical protein